MFLQTARKCSRSSLGLEKNKTKPKTNKHKNKQPTNILELLPNQSNNPSNQHNYPDSYFHLTSPDNKVRVVKKSAFKRLPRLMTLDLSNNQLVRIYSKGFEGMDQLQTLSLQYNRLRSISRIFGATPKLYQLNLAFNQLREIGKSDLQTPTKIHYLDLRNNRIRKIHPEAFAHLTLLRYGVDQGTAFNKC